MSYSLKIEPEGWELAVLIQELAESARFSFNLNLTTTGDLLGAIGKFSGCLPLGMGEWNTLKLDLSEGELDVVLVALQRALTRDNGRQDERTITIRKLLRTIKDYMAAADEARLAGGA